MLAVIKNMVQRLEDGAGSQLESVVLYGAAAHDDYEQDTQHCYLMIVLKDVSLRSIESVAEPIRWWLKQGGPMPRLFSRESLRDSADVFPIEILNITAHHVVVSGQDPLLDDIDIDSDNLRLQCERELREKLMRVQEAYVEVRGRDKDLERLLAESYRAFASVFRGCLQLMTGGAPKHNIEAVERFCSVAELDVSPFKEIDQLVATGKLSSDIDDLFARYYAELCKAVEAVDRFRTKHGGSK